MKMLVVDDELVSRAKLVKILAEYGECIIAESGEDALVEFEHALNMNSPFELITLDINLSEMSGVEVLKNIREIEKSRHIPTHKLSKIIMVTVHSEKDVVINCMKAGSNNYIIKPFTPKYVGDKIRSLGIEI
jgi:two-component system chemotaxis response regulator CheY